MYLGVGGLEWVYWVMYNMHVALSPWWAMYKVHVVARGGGGGT